MLDTTRKFQESTTCEFKQHPNAKFEKDIVAFLNTSGGKLYIGINDEGLPVGVKGDLDKQQLLIKDRIKNNILPSTIGLFEISVVNIDDNDVIKVTIAQGNQQPYYLREVGQIAEGCFIRIGTSSEMMSDKIIEKKLSSRTRNNLKNITAPSQNLTFNKLRIFYEEKGYHLNDNFEHHLNLKTEAGNYNYIAYLLADYNNISIKLAIYDGLDMLNLVEVNEFGNNCLVQSTLNVLEKLKVENTNRTKITPTVREERRLVNPIALREAVVNAIVHTTWENEIPPKFEIFDDKISISSSSGLPSTITKEEFLNGFSAPVNPELMKVFSDLGLVEQLGTGVTRILKYYDKSIFEIFPNFIRVSFPFKAIYEETSFSFQMEELLTKRQIGIIQEIKKNPQITQVELAKIYGVSERTIRRDFDDLIEKKLITRIVRGKGGFWKIVSN